MIQLIELIAAFIIGIAFSKSKFREPVKKYVNKYLIWFGLPLLVFVSISRGETTEIVNVAGAALLLIILFSLISYFAVSLLKGEPKRKATLFMTGAFGNNGYLGIPLGLAFFGPTGAFLASIFSMANGIIHYSFGIFLANRFVHEKKAALRKALTFPLFYAFLAALALSFFGITIPEPIYNFSFTATYLAVFIIGISISMKSFSIPDIAKTASLKFLALPVIGAVLAFLFIGPDERLPFVFQCFMPPALVNTSISLEYGLDSEYAAAATSILTAVFLAVVFALSFFI